MKKNISENSNSTYSKSEISEINVMRCPNCFQIPFISIDNSKETPYLIFNCQNNHKVKENFKSLYEKSKQFQIDTIKCVCERENDISKIFYCTKCFGFYCERELHSLKENHYLIPVLKMDYVCYDKNHNETPVFYYCKDDNKNICNYCIQEGHKDHNFEKFINLKREIDNFENDINNARNALFNLKRNVHKFLTTLYELIKEINRKFKSYLEIHEIEFNMLQDLINTYRLKETKKNFNYQIIYNIKNVIKFNKIENILNNDLIDYIKNVFDKQIEKFFIKSSSFLIKESQRNNYPLINLEDNNIYNNNKNTNNKNNNNNKNQNNNSRNNVDRIPKKSFTRKEKKISVKILFTIIKLNNFYSIKYFYLISSVNNILFKIVCNLIIIVRLYYFKIII